jgi:hypothetical protein
LKRFFVFLKELKDAPLPVTPDASIYGMLSTHGFVQLLPKAKCVAVHDFSAGAKSLGNLGG